MQNSLLKLYSKRLYLKIKHRSDSEESKIIYNYRYLSWALTSVVYLAGIPHAIFIFKIGVILSFLISSIVFTELYIQFNNHTRFLKTMLLIETLGITLLLLHTGGLTSPFIWYTFNPTLVAACYLPTSFCWINLSFFLLAASIMTFYNFNPNHMNLITILIDNYNLVLAFVLITIVVQLLARLSKQLSFQANALKLSNQQKQESMNDIMTLYKILEAMDNHCSKEKLFEKLAAYTSSLMKSELSIFWLPASSNETEIIQVSKSINSEELQEVLIELKKLKFQQNSTKKVETIRLLNSYYLTIPIFTSTAPCGFIASQIKMPINKDELEQKIKLLEFLSGLCAVTLERFLIEDMEEHLLVMDEQNRIANEMHDSVSQRLFSISYGIHAILKSWDNITNDQLQKYLVEIHESAMNAMEELRNAIYRLSSKKKNEKSLHVTLKSLLDNIAKLHNIVINFNTKGDETLLSLSVKQIISRILSEACSNAIRHGNCSMINIVLTICMDSISLTIQDNGKGFWVSNENPKLKTGLGLSNMRSLITAHNGSMNISSEVGIGTNIQCSIPLVKDNSGIRNLNVS